jgi:hypothetical protein
MVDHQSLDVVPVSQCLKFGVHTILVHLCFHSKARVRRALFARFGDTARLGDVRAIEVSHVCA